MPSPGPTQTPGLGPLPLASAIRSYVETVNAAGMIAMSFYIFVGRWSDRVGRKKPIVIGALLTLGLLFPIFWGMGQLANPGLAATAVTRPCRP